MRFCFLTWLILWGCLAVHAQKGSKVVLKSAQNLSYNKENNPDYQILSGNVVFQHNDTYLYCDSALLFVNTNKVEAYGNTQVQAPDNVQLFGKRMKYDGETRIAEVEKDVLLVNGTTALNTDKLTYNLDTKTAYYLEGGVITDPRNKLISRKGYYHSDTKEFFFRDSVKVYGNNFRMISDSLMYNSGTELVRFYGHTRINADSATIFCQRGWYDTKTDKTQLNDSARLYKGSSYLQGDSLYYDKLLGFGKAKINVVFRDTLEKTKITCNYGIFHMADSSVMATDSAVFYSWAENDTLYLHADTLHTFKDSLNFRNLRAFYGVVVYKSDLQAVGDSMYYSGSDSLMTFYGDPVLWSDSAQVKADTISIRSFAGTLDRLYLDENAFVISRYALDDYHQIKGRRMTGYFIENQLSSLRVHSDAESIYFLEDDQGRKNGINVCKSDAMLIGFAENTVTAISLLGNPDGTIFPNAELAPEQRILAGFKLYNTSRPHSVEDLFRIKPHSSKKSK